MNHFERQASGELFAEGASLQRIAQTHGTPCYVYSSATLRRHVEVMRSSLGDLSATLCYAVKANSNIGILSLLAKLGTGFDIVSGGELARVQRAGGDVSTVVFSGVGKQANEMAAALEAGILLFNVESGPELELLAQVAREVGKRARIAIRVNPEVDAQTHPYIATGLRESKFGVRIEDARALYARAKLLDSIEVVGVDCHIGSQILQLQPFAEALDRICDLVLQLRAQGHDIRYLDVGGGLGVPYHDEEPPAPEAYGHLVREKVQKLGCHVLLEPGRVLVANAGILLTRVIYVKTSAERTFVIVDGAMNDLIRPSLYQAYHHIEPVMVRAGEPRVVDVVGPVCESGDFFAKQRSLPPLQAGDLIALRTAGAYGFTMASNYNSRPRAVELLVSGERLQVIRQRETLDDLWRGEMLVDSSLVDSSL